VDSEETRVRKQLVNELTRDLRTCPAELSRRLDRLGVEEAYYWYAQCSGPAGLQARRALRCLLGVDAPPDRSASRL